MGGNRWSDTPRRPSRWLKFVPPAPLEATAAGPDTPDRAGRTTADSTPGGYNVRLYIADALDMAVTACDVAIQHGYDEAANGVDLAVCALRDVLDTLDGAA